jgi:predicted MFS family arabinose efflux permease
VGVLVWSVATVASGLAGTFLWLLVARAFTGFGEAGYGTAAPTFISDLFKKEHRSRMLAIFYTAMPLGAALGYVLGGWVGEHFGWHAAFFVGGAPGLILGTASFFLTEPVRGGMDEPGEATKVPFADGLKALAGNARFWFATAGLTLYTFSVGGLSFFMKKFLETERGFSPTTSGVALGATTVIGGFVGTLLGGWLGDRLDKRLPGGGILLSAIGFLAATPLMVLSVYAKNDALLLGCLVVAQILLFLNNGPLNAAIANAVSPGFRAFAFSLSTVLLHLFGDAISPFVIGGISDASSLGTAIVWNAVPVLLAGLVLLWGLRSFRAEPLARPST